jgi:hypothetical protein
LILADSLEVVVFARDKVRHLRVLPLDRIFIVIIDDDNGISIFILHVTDSIGGFNRTWCYGAVSAAIVFRCVVDKFVVAEEIVRGETGSSICRQARGRRSCSRSSSSF